MMNKTQLFIDKFLDSEKIRCIYLTPHSPVALRYISGDVELIGDSVTPSGAMNFFTYFLGEASADDLRKLKRLVREFKIKDHILVLDAYLSNGSVTFTITKKETVKNQVEDYPQMITNFLNLKSGLMIGTHTKTSEISRIERDLFIQKLNMKKDSSLYFANDKELPIFNKNAFVVNVNDKDKRLFESFAEEVELIRYGLIQNQEDLVKISSYLSSGCFVIAHMQAARVSEALVKLQSWLSKWEDRFLMSQFLIGIYSFINWTYDQKLNYAFEAYAFGPEVKKNFYGQEPKEFFKFFENDFKNNGLSFSQSLHTKVLKRSIDLRKAFELAPDPSDLDYILKKSGI